jgi:hypothetical protein
MANEKTFVAGSNPANYWHSPFGGGDGYYTVGNYSGTDSNGAIRFTGVTGTGNCNSASLYLYVCDYDNSGGGSGDLVFDVYGADEDNTASFTGDPMGRSQTSATYNITRAINHEGYYESFEVTNIVNEIRSRGGWSSGNAMAFLLYKNGSSDADVYISGGPEDVPTFDYCALVIRESAEPNFNPTDKSVAAPTFPDVDHVGFKISYPGYSVLDATEDELYYTTKKRKHKIYLEGETTTTANVVKNIAHGLAYLPFCMVYVKETGSTKRYKIPRYIPQAIFQDQFSGLDTTNGTVQVDATNLKITTTSNCTVYYRIFLDQIS